MFLDSSYLDVLSLQRHHFAVDTQCNQFDFTFLHLRFSRCFNQQNEEDILGNIMEYHNRDKVFNLQEDFSASKTRKSSFDMKTCSYKTKLYVKNNTSRLKEADTKNLLLAKECSSQRFFLSDKGEIDVVFKVLKIEEYIDFAATKLR